MIERYHDGSTFEARASYCRAIRSGHVVAVSGTAATAEDGAALFPGDTYAQTREALERALRALAEFGGSVEHVVRTRLFLVPTSDWQGAVRAHQEAFAGNPPANTTLYVAGFIPPGVLVEVEVDAWLTA